jgi:hypothetical protein
MCNYNTLTKKKANYFYKSGNKIDSFNKAINLWKPVLLTQVCKKIEPENSFQALYKQYYLAFYFADGFDSPLWQVLQVTIVSVAVSG